MKLLILTLAIVSGILMIGKASATMPTYERAREVRVGLRDCRVMVSPEVKVRLIGRHAHAILSIAPSRSTGGRPKSLSVKLLDPGHEHSPLLEFKLREIKKSVDGEILYGRDEVRERGHFSVIAPVDTYVHYTTQYGGMQLRGQTLKVFREIQLKSGQLVREFAECRTESALDLPRLHHDLSP